MKTPKFLRQVAEFLKMNGEEKRKVYVDNVSKGIFAIISAAVLALFALVKGLRDPLWNAAAKLFTYASQREAFPRWSVLLPWVVVGAIFVAWIARRYGRIGLPMLVRQIAQPESEQAAPPWTDYVEDEFDGIIWRWTWQETSASNLKGFCPKCGARLIIKPYMDEDDMRVADKRIGTSFWCPVCNSARAIKNVFDPDEVWGVKIEQRRDSGTWKERMSKPWQNEQPKTET